MQYNAIEAEKEEADSNTLRDTCLEILTERIETTSESSSRSRYKDILENQISLLNNSEDIFKENGLFGTLNESLFYYAFKNTLHVDIEISKGKDDIHGIDFLIHLSKKNIPVDVTINQKKYASKMKSKEKMTLLLPVSDYVFQMIHEHENFNKEMYLQNIFNLNMAILNNRYEKYEVLTKEKGSSYKKIVSEKYKKEKSQSTKEPIERIFLSEDRYKSYIELLSLLKNFIP